MMTLSLAGAVLAIMMAVMIAGWLYQRARDNGGWTDVFWTFGTGASCALAALAPWGDHPGWFWRRLLVAAMVAGWALRLGLYVARRVARSREDVRYATFRQDWGRDFQKKMFGLLIVQAPVTALISVSVILAARRPGDRVLATDVLGALLFLGAVGGEAMADAQMKAFKARATNDGGICDVGLWAWSRHPNYVFEAALWIAYAVIAFDASRPVSLAALSAPTIMFFIVRFGTGVPPLEEAMLKSKGDRYRRYQERVSTFFPRPPRPRRPDSKDAQPR